MVFTGEMVNLVRVGGYILETHAGSKMGCEENRGVKDEGFRFWD